MNARPLIVEEGRFEKGYNCFCSPVGVMLALHSLPFINSVLYQRWDFLYDQNQPVDFYKLIGMLHRLTQSSIKENLSRLYQIELKKKVEPDGLNAFKLLKQRLDNGTPIMVMLDLYQLHYLPHSQRQNHHLHFLIVTGYNEHTNEVSIIDSFAGYNGTIPLDIFNGARQGIINGMSLQNRWYEFEFPADIVNVSQTTMENFVKRSIKHIFHPLSDTINGPDALQMFVADIQTWQKADVKNQMRKAAEYIRDIEWQRKGFLAFLKEIKSYLKPETVEELFNLVQEIIDMWAGIRRSLYLNHFRDDTTQLVTMASTILEITKKEKQFVYNINSSQNFIFKS